MTTILLILVVLLIAVSIFLWFAFQRKTKTRDEDTAVYTCSICGEKDCICHLTHDDES